MTDAPAPTTPTEHGGGRPSVPAAAVAPTTPAG
ncbi:unannotated protein [freshwater metagenome]|uniref:Unannotated protein n=1 Tax=freshwater metagenome TaxID=449393 RepID=A0A6J7GS09_9ZZZZ